LQIDRQGVRDSLLLRRGKGDSRCGRRSVGDSGQNDLFKARLDLMVDMGHPLAKFAAAIDWGFLERTFGAVYTDAPGQPPLPTRLMAGLAILKHMDTGRTKSSPRAGWRTPYIRYELSRFFYIGRPRVG
jgi:hypothetical protein